MNNPLVSIYVCTYNSSKTIIETLESILSQTYKNIELVISDDDSKDDSVKVCEKWVSDNKARFVRTQIVSHTPNTGTSANANRAVFACQGEWIKGIGGDDKLLPNCIEDFIWYISEHPHATIIFSRVVGFGNIEAAQQWPWLNVKRFFDNLTPLQFRIILSTQNFLPAASVFLKKSVWKGLGGYEESIPLLEDWPFWVKAMSNGYTFDFMDKETVAYRFSEMSISQGIVTLSERYLDSNRKASIYAGKSLKKLGFFYFLFYQTRKLLGLHILGMGKVVFILNIFNPAFYKYRNTLKLFDKLQVYEISI